DLLRAVRLTGATFFDVVARAPWCAEQPTREQVLPKILPGATHLISYHVVTDGECWAQRVDRGHDEAPVHLTAGEVVVFTKGDPHIMASAPGMRAQPVTQEEIEAATAGPLPFFRDVFNAGGGKRPPSVKLVCGFLACDGQPFNPLFDNLPPVIKSGRVEGEESSWLGECIRVAMLEAAATRAGGESGLAKLTELMFIEVVRRYLEALPAGQAG